MDRSAMSVLEGKKYAPACLGHVLVLGLGVSGKAVTEYLISLPESRVASVTVLGGRSHDAIEAWADGVRAKDKGGKLRIIFDCEDAASVVPDDAEAFDVCIASPGISAFSDFYISAQNKSRSIISEVEFAWRESLDDSTWIAVTGTNGKTTTTSLIAHILDECGCDAKAVGNIGDACIDQVARDNANGLSRPVYVVETSSYQLASIDMFAPNVAVILGITPDHIKWHKTHAHYAASKFNLLRNLSNVDGAVAVLDATNDEVRSKVREIKQADGTGAGFAYVPLGTACGVRGDMREACGSRNAAFVGDGGDLVVAMDGIANRLCNASELRILGAHNQINALAAGAAAIAAGISAEDVSRALTTFNPLPHRIEPVGTKGEVSYYNDSKATNVDATLQAIKAFIPERPIVMLGGDDKGTDLAELVGACEDHAKAVICYGAAGPRFYEAFSGSGKALCQDGESLSANKCSKNLDSDGLPVIMEQTFENAFRRATQLAEPGDIVLLSPACASFDEFSCFEERGDRFRQLVAALED